MSDMDSTIVDVSASQPPVLAAEVSPTDTTPSANTTTPSEVTVQRGLTSARLGVIGALIIVLGALFYALTPFAEPTPQAPALVPDPISTDTRAVPFPKVNIAADSAIVYDVQNDRVLYAKNPDAQLPLASITKLMTVLVAADVFHDEGLLTFDQSDLAGSSDSISALPSTQWIPSDVFTYTLMQSSNPGAASIAAAVGSTQQPSAADRNPGEHFVDLMNAKATELGLTQTYFINETGLDETHISGGGYGSARDAARLIAALATAYPDILEPTRLPAKKFQSLDHKSITAINTNTSIGSIPGLIGSKTGYTKLAGGNLVVLFDAGLGQPIAVSVLGSTEQGRFSDVEKLVEATLSHLGEVHSTNTL
jgi:D-alanyl-D-alanine carboxypeptidase